MDFCSPQTEHDGVIYSIIAFANEQKTQARIDYQYELIQLLVERGFITAKYVLVVFLFLDCVLHIQLPTTMQKPPH